MREVALIHLSPEEIADFVAVDMQLLSKTYRVRPVLYRGILHGWPDAWRIFWAVVRSDASLSWFAYRQAYFAVRFSRILGKRAVVVVGGFDVAPEERPGGRIPSSEERQLRYILAKATAVLAVSERLATLARQWTDRQDLRVVPLAFDGLKFTPGQGKDGSVVTIAYVRKDNVERKGLRSFVRAAHELPERQFYVVGKVLDDSIFELRKDAPPNVVFSGWLETRQLIALLQKASVYVQASLHEGFGSALAQSMLCECVPVVTSSGAIPEVVGPSGVYIRSNQPGAVAAGVRTALSQPDLGKQARKRILERFSLQRRESALRHALEG
jgi:glycosyltransferase involved in cell wall biosynthesis